MKGFAPRYKETLEIGQLEFGLAALRLSVFALSFASFAVKAVKRKVRRVDRKGRKVSRKVASIVGLRILDFWLASA
jgi:hypothetical protein